MQSLKYNHIFLFHRTPLKIKECEDKRQFFETFVEKIQDHPDYESKYLNNNDTYTRELAYDKIMEQVALSMRKLQLDFAKQWMDTHFKQDFKSGTQRFLR